MTLDPHRDRTALRLKLYENGFTPLANKSKMCLIPEWSTIDVTPDLIQSPAWARSRAFQDTGIRCGDVIALDWDIDDKALLNKLLDAVVENGLVEESPFVRIGRPPRELWVYRTNDKIGKRTTGHFMPFDVEAGNGFAVEVLGKGCQFAAFGQRDENTEYSWPEQSLLDHQYMDLPTITLAQVEALKEFCILFFELNGLVRKSPSGGTDAGYTHAYDLTPDMVFDVQDLGLMSVAEIDEGLRHSPEGEVWRCKVDALRPTSGSWAGMVSLVNGVVCISDHGNYTSHFPEDADDGAALSKLGALLAERFPEQPLESSAPDTQLDVAAPDLDPRQMLDENIARALRRYVYSVGSDQVFDIRRPREGMKVEHFRNSMRQFYEVKNGPKGGEQRTWLADQWQESGHRITVRTVGLRPDQPWPLFFENGEHHLNTYRPLELPTHGDASIGWAFIEHLLPIPAERHFFTQWLSYKFQHPDVRGPGVIMVAHDQYGTGRGSLVALIRAMVAEPLVRTIDFATLSGKTYQSQYNEWLVDSIFAVVNEAKEAAPNMSLWQTRNNAYEHLKAIIDPGENHTEVMRKGGKNGPGKTYCSILVLTNHMDSVVLPKNDRRLSILENGTPMPESYWVDFRRWLANPANVGAFRAELMRYDLVGYNPFTAPPMTAAKADMVDAGSSEIDRLFGEAMGRYSNTVLVREQVELAVEDLLMESSAEVPDDWKTIVGRMFLRATRKVTAINDRVKIDGRVRTARLIGRPAPEVVSSHELLVLEIERNGPITRQMKSSGKVVDFSTRKTL